MIRRREFITLAGGAAAWPLAAQGQPRNTPLIGYLGSRTPTGDTAYIEAFRRGLAQSGFVSDRDVAIEFKWAEGRSDRLPAMAAEFVRRHVDVIVCAGGEAVPVAKAATSTIPIVFSTGLDPVKSGLVV